MIDFPRSVDLQLADLNLAVNAAFYAIGRVLGMAATWNLVLLASFLLAAGLMWRLALRLGASPGGAWLAGLFYAASPYWVASALNGWCYLVHTWTLPLVLLAALHARDQPGLRSGAGLGLSLAVAFHVTPYYFLYAGVLLAVLAVLRLETLRAWLRQRDARLALLAAAGLLAVLIGPRVVAMSAAASRGLVAHHGPLNTVLALPVVEMLWPSRASVASRVPHLGYLVGFVGWTLLATLAASLWCRGAAGVRSWLVAAAAMWLLALGPRIVWAQGLSSRIPLPGTLLQRLPAFDLTTNHWRWSLPGGFCLAVALALSFGALERRLAAFRPAWARAALPLVVALWALEVVWVWPLPYPRPLSEPRASPVAELLRGRSDVHAVLDRSGHRKLNQMVHGKPIALGWLPRLDLETQRANEALVAACGERGPECLRRYGIDAVIRDDHTALLLDDDGSVREVLVSEP
jgi:hypothetical protein